MLQTTMNVHVRKCFILQGKVAAFVRWSGLYCEWCLDDETIDDDIEQSNEWMQYANVSSQFPVYVIEVLIVIDYAIYRR